MQEGAIENARACYGGLFHKRSGAIRSVADGQNPFAGGWVLKCLISNKPRTRIQKSKSANMCNFTTKFEIASSNTDNSNLIFFNAIPQRSCKSGVCKNSTTNGLLYCPHHTCFMEGCNKKAQVAHHCYEDARALGLLCKNEKCRNLKVKNENSCKKCLASSQRLRRCNECDLDWNNSHLNDDPDEQAKDEEVSIVNRECDRSIESLASDSWIDSCLDDEFLGEGMSITSVDQGFDIATERLAQEFPAFTSNHSCEEENFLFYWENLTLENFESSGQHFIIFGGPREDCDDETFKYKRVISVEEPCQLPSKRVKRINK